MLLTEKFILLALLLQTIEFRQIRSVFSAETGIWRQDDLRLGLPPFLRLFLLPAQGFEALLLFRMVLIVLTAFLPSAWGFWLLFLSQLLIQLRVRGPFNGGSDYLTTLSLLCLAIWRSFPTDSLLSQAGLLYLGLQLVSSYWIAGIAKVRHSEWRSGKALGLFLQLPKYQVPRRWHEQAFDNSSFLRWSTWAVLIFELSFPVVLLQPALCWLFLPIGAAFHWMNVRIFGLNRFFWIWLSCYPALIECTLWLNANF